MATTLLMRMKHYSCIFIVTITLLLSTCVSRVDTNDSENARPNTELSLMNVIASSCNSVKVYFNNEVELESAEAKSNYSIPGLNILSVTRDITDPSIVMISTSNHEDINYRLTVDGVKDVYGNYIGADNLKLFGGDAAPYMKYVSSYSNKDVIVDFSEAVEKTSAENSTNYNISGLTVTSATRDTVDHMRVVLKTSSQMNATTYTITINNVTDLNGNCITIPNSKNFIGNGPIDSTAPTVLFAGLVDDNTLEVQFSEPMDQISSEITGNYTLKDNTSNSISVTAAARQSENSKVWLDIDGLFSDCLA